MKYILLILLGFISCKTNTEGLEITILSKELIAYCPDTECIYPDRFLKEGIYDIDVNILRFKIENKSDQTYFFMPIGRRGENGNVTYNSFPKLFSGLSLRNLLIKNNKGNELERGGHAFHLNKFEQKTDSLMSNYYQKMEYKMNRTLGFFTGLAQRSVLIIPAGETIFYETYFTLPLNQTFYGSSQEFFKLDKKENYNVSLIFAGEKELVEKRLTNAQKETIKHNNYKIFDGTLISTNSVPIIFKE